MDLLEDTIAQIAFELPPERIALIAEQIKVLSFAVEIDKVRRFFGVNFDELLYQKLVKTIKETPDLTGRELAMAFQAALATVHYSDVRGRAELLWTGPQTSAIAMRHTEQALCELISSACRSIFIVSFVAYKADQVVAALNNAQMRNVEIKFLLETAQENGGNVSIDSFRILQDVLPSAKFYMWSTDKKVSKAAVHAKCAVADDSMALITSANLTGKAMESNMEIGTLIKGGNLPKQLKNHLEALITEKIIAPVSH